MTLLFAGGLTALAAEATAWSADTAAFYGMVKVASDLVLGIGGVWLVLTLASFLLRVRR